MPFLSEVFHYQDLPGAAFLLSVNEADSVNVFFIVVMLLVWLLLNLSLEQRFHLVQSNMVFPPC